MLTRAVILALAVGGAWGAVTAQASVPNPVVQGPIHGGVRGYPWNHTLLSLKERNFNYTEKEYFFGGTATDLQTHAKAPYQSRMLVRLPRHPRDFSGTVLVEWLNVTGQSDYETAWPVEAKYLMRHGIGYVGVSAQEAGVCCGPTTLKGWDPVRYATLAHPEDVFSYDIFSQAIRALRRPAGNRTSTGVPRKVNPMGGMRVRHLIVTGASQSASFLTTFVNQGYNRGQIDAYVITRGGGPFDDFSTPIFQLNEENNLPDQPDNRHYVVWEEAGTAHAPAVWWNDYIWPEQQRDLFTPGTPNAIDAACSVNHGAVDFSTRAMSHWTSRYLRTGKLPPSAPRIRTDSSGNVVRDADGLAKGGLRHSFVQVPVSYNSSEGCPLYGTFTPWTAAKIKSHYRSHRAYVRKVRAWTAHEMRRGWLLRPDRKRVMREARHFRGPWNGGNTVPPQGL